MTARILFVLLVMATAGAQEGAPGETYEWLGDCPSSCCGYSSEWTAAADSPAWREAPPPEVRVPGGEPAFVVRAGEPVRAVTGSLQVLERGLAVMREDFSTDASYASLSARHRQTITFLENEEVHLLAPRGEETWRIWHRGRIVDAHLYRFGSEEACRAPAAACAGVIVDDPITRWWVMVIDREGRSGWADAARFEKPAPCR